MKVATSLAGVAPDGLPVIVMVYVPPAAVEVTLTVIVDVVPAVDGVMGFGLNAAVTPVLGPETLADNVTAVAVPDVRVAVTVAVVVTVVEPLVTVALEGLTARL